MGRDCRVERVSFSPPSAPLLPRGLGLLLSQGPSFCVRDLVQNRVHSGYMTEHNYRLLIEFSAEQKDHLDSLRAQRIPASVYIRGLIDADRLSRGGGVYGNTPPMPTHTNDAGPSLMSGDTPSYSGGDTSSYSGGAGAQKTPTSTNDRYPGDHTGGGWQ